MDSELNKLKEDQVWRLPTFQGNNIFINKYFIPIWVLLLLKWDNDKNNCLKRITIKY